MKKKIRQINKKQLIYQSEKLEMHRAFMTGYVKRINEASFNVPIAGIRIGSAKYSRLAQINLETRIITFSRYAIENVPERGRRYLVLHELAHVKETNHTKLFWQLVGKYEPEYRQIGKSLELAFKQNIKEEEKKARSSILHINNLYVSRCEETLEDMSQNSFIDTSFDLENDLVETIAQCQESVPPNFDCELSNFLNWTIE